MEVVMETYIKLYRKILDNEIMRDSTALAVFIYCLCRADKNSGKFTAGRWQISASLRIKDTTIYKALKRLQKWRMIEQTSNNRFTEFLILNWDKYQCSGNTSSKNQVKTKEKPSNTLQELRIENKEYISKDILGTLQQQFPNKSVLEEYEKFKDYILSTGTSYRNHLAAFRNWLRRSYEVKKSATPKDCWAVAEDGKWFNTKEDLDLALQNGIYKIKEGKVWKA